jgi:single-stranded DNA-binding protein
LGKDPEYQELEAEPPDGNVSVATFSLATTESFKDKNGQTQTTTDWHASPVAHGGIMAQPGRVSPKVFTKK